MEILSRPLFDKVLALHFTQTLCLSFKKNISPTKFAAHENTDIVSNHFLDLIWLEVKDQQNFSTSKNGVVGWGELDYRLFRGPIHFKSLWFYSAGQMPEEENSAIYSQTGGEGQ